MSSQPPRRELELPPTDRLAEAEASLGLTFQRKDLLRRAFVHRSYLNENLDYNGGSNERLEFLGDAVLGFVTAEYLFKAFPSTPEGDLTDLRAALVRASTLTEIADQLGLGTFLYLGKGEEATGGRGRGSLLARAFEAVVGAIYVDQGLEAARRFILPLLAPELARVLENDLAKDPKSRLQEVTQADRGLAPVYETVESVGPDHAREFLVEARLGVLVLAVGRGYSKLEAEEVAARTALASWSATERTRQSAREETHDDGVGGDG